MVNIKLKWYLVLLSYIKSIELTELDTFPNVLINATNSFLFNLPENSLGDSENNIFNAVPNP